MTDTIHRQAKLGWIASRERPLRPQHLHPNADPHRRTGKGRLALGTAVSRLLAANAADFMFVLAVVRQGPGATGSEIHIFRALRFWLRTTASR